jgi:DNA-binding XRE family transcriptional regulator
MVGTFQETESLLQAVEAHLNAALTQLGEARRQIADSEMDAAGPAQDDASLLVRLDRAVESEAALRLFSAIASDPPNEDGSVTVLWPHRPAEKLGVSVKSVSATAGRVRSRVSVGAPNRSWSAFPGTWKTDDEGQEFFTLPSIAVQVLRDRTNEFTWISERRSSAGLSVDDLSQRSGVDGELIAALEAGRAKPSVQEAIALSRAMA